MAIVPNCSPPVVRTCADERSCPPAETLCVGFAASLREQPTPVHTLVRMAHKITLSDLSSLGTDTLDLSDALAYAQRARAVALREKHDPNDLKKLRRVVRLKVVVTTEVPAILGELTHLRSLSIVGKALKTVPPAVFRLPRLEFLFLEDTQLDDLAGLALSTSLRTVIFRNTPLEHNAAKRAKILASLSAQGWGPDTMFRSNGFTRVVPKSGAIDTRDKTTLLRAIHDDNVPQGVSLKRADLGGGTFEDVLVDFSLERANLEKTTWRRCDFERTKMAGANLKGAVFEDCAFDGVEMTKAKAAGAVFRRCALDLDLSQADLTGARFTDNEPCPNLDLSDAKAQNMVLEVVTLSESELDVDLAGADLRGASIRCDITTDRRKELESKPKAKVKWATLELGSAKQDASTTIEMALLPGVLLAKQAAASSAAPAPKTDPARVVEHLGRLDATNAAMWFLAMDATDAAAWDGEDEDEFDRAMDVGSGVIKVGSLRGVLAEMGDCGWAHVWRTNHGDLLLVEHRRSGIYAKLPKAEQISALGERIASVAVPKKRTRIGKFSVKSGVLALMLPYCKGKFTAKQLEAASVRGGDRLLVRVPPGEYEISCYPFAEPGFEDELGSYGDVTRIAWIEAPKEPAK
ncbi:MAG: pentapeptide repeat-containing protein [Deltaproteobacteria bacterium]|nr:pentapeptide repeat-containing protein [Deltaproteobacteria bacterium]